MPSQKRMRPCFPMQKLRQYTVYIVCNAMLLQEREKIRIYIQNSLYLNEETLGGYTRSYK